MNQGETRRFRPTRTARLVVAWVVIVSCSGCSDSPSKSLFDESSHLPTGDKLVEIELGEFVVPVPITLNSAAVRFEKGNLMQIELSLFAVVEPKHIDTFRRRLEHNANRVRARVIEVCRSASREDLMEPLKTSLKTQLLDGLQPLLDGPTLRRVGIRRVEIDEL